MTGKEFKNTYMKPIVYTWKRGEEYLYIGSSKVGINRMVNNTNLIIHALNIQDDDEIIIDYFETGNEARAAERNWIRRYHPRYNSRQGRADTNYQLFIQALRFEELPAYQQLINEEGSDEED